MPQYQVQKLRNLVSKIKMTCQFKQLICRLLWSTSCIAMTSEHQTGKHNLTKIQFSEENDGFHKARPPIAAAVSGNCQLCSSSSSSSCSSSWTILLWTNWQVRKCYGILFPCLSTFNLSSQPDRCQVEVQEGAGWWSDRGHCQVIYHDHDNHNHSIYS